MAAQGLVLLTGATGFIGFRTLVFLLEKGYNVRCAVRNEAGYERIKALKSAAPYASQMQSILVPDITVPGAYDEAVKGVDYVIHAASPFAAPALLSSEEYEANYIQPAIAGTVGMLDSATKASSIKRVVITASILSIMSLQDGAKSVVITETNRTGNSKGPWPSWLAAYSSSKVAALEATEEWTKKNLHTFDLINIEPCFVIGRDETATDVGALLKGSNYMALAHVIGHGQANPAPGIPVHVDDVAAMHVQALDSSIPGNEDYLSVAEPIQWTETIELVKKHFPKEVEAGIFSFNGTPITAPLITDNSKARKTFGINFKTYEEQILSVAKQYLELVKQAA
ncbi:hypothetical protein NQ176_g2045 [Zarea fungicola]|uniref:Uncharacterized protein n=1 Tax=Zarea fungicola TaxID=93591 RepID=A0ACC1NSU0_9HYPO|nr:hypothetical protein NQ176_g2045 [Lecanicillium fungicola]